MEASACIGWPVDHFCPLRKEISKLIPMLQKGEYPLAKACESANPLVAKGKGAMCHLRCFKVSDVRPKNNPSRKGAHKERTCYCYWGEFRF